MTVLGKNYILASQRKIKNEKEKENKGKTNFIHKTGLVLIWKQKYKKKELLRVSDCSG